MGTQCLNIQLIRLHDQLVEYPAPHYLHCIKTSALINFVPGASANRKVHEMPTYATNISGLTISMERNISSIDLTGTSLRTLQPNFTTQVPRITWILDSYRIQSILINTPLGFRNFPLSWSQDEITRVTLPRKERANKKIARSCCNLTVTYVFG